MGPETGLGVGLGEGDGSASGAGAGAAAEGVTDGTGVGTGPGAGAVAPTNCAQSMVRLKSQPRSLTSVWESLRFTKLMPSDDVADFKTHGVQSKQQVCAQARRAEAIRGMLSESRPA